MALDTLTIDTSQLTARVQKLAALAGPAFGQAIVPVVNEALKVGAFEVVRLLSGPVLKRRTGNAAASVIPVPASAEGNTVTGSVGSNVRYLHFQFKGGVIRAKDGGFLAIPLDAALTPAGVPKYPSPLRETLKSAFLAGTFVAKGVLFGKLGTTKTGRNRLSGKGQIGFGRSNVVALFSLKKQVTIPPHDYLTEPKRQMMLQFTRSRFIAALKGVIA